MAALGKTAFMVAESLLLLEAAGFTCSGSDLLLYVGINFPELRNGS
jgi:hypothetical protein